MNRLPMFAGLDYHQNVIQVCVQDHTGQVRLNRSCNNDPSEVTALLRQAGPVSEVSLEACCGAAAFGEALAAMGFWRVNLAHAGYVSRLRSSPDKTDFSDARLLSDLTRVGYLPSVWLAPPEIRDLRQLVRHRQSLVNQRRNLKLQIGATLREQRVKVGEHGRWSRLWVEAVREHVGLSPAVRWIIQEKLAELAWLSGRLERASDRLREVSSVHDLYHRLHELEGVGEVTAWTLLAHIGRFDRFKNGKQLARYCGLSPRNASSGEKNADAGLVNACSRELRAVLIQCGHGLLRRPGRWRELADKLKRRGKPTNVVVAAIANRWVRSMHWRLVSSEKTQTEKKNLSEKDLTVKKPSAKKLTGKKKCL